MRALRLSIPFAAALTVALLQPAAAEPVKIRVGWIVAPASLVPLLFLKPELAKHYNKSYTFDPVHFASSTLQITAISQGEIDIAAFGYTSFPLAIQNGGLSDLRIIADEIQDGAPGYYSGPYFVRKDSGIDKIEDMKGKVAATNGLGQRRRHRNTRGTAQAWPRSDARLHDDRSALPGPQGDPQGEKG
jgi:ABC-type nitrate/sulfonate/bicarbonate transport system substrate-binding protein